MLFTCQCAAGASCRVVVCFMASLYTNGGKNQYLYYKNIAQKSAADFMQIDGMNILIYIVYNSWTMTMPLRGRRSPVAPFSCSDVKSYGKEKYSVIHFSYSLIIHCFNGKQLCYTLKKLEYTRIVWFIVYYAMNILYKYSYLYYQE